MRLIILVFLFVAGCQTTQTPMSSCSELNQSFMNTSHDNFLIESCLIDNRCAEQDGDCLNSHSLTCMEQYFKMKAEQARDYKSQACWRSEAISS